MAKKDILLDKTFLIICGVLLVLIAGGVILYLSNSNGHYPTGTAAVVEFRGQDLTINSTSVVQLIDAAAQQNVTINQSFAIDQLAQEAILTAQEKALKIVPTDAQITTALNTQLQSLDAQGLNAALAAQNMSRDAFVANLRSSINQNLVLQLLFQQEVGSKIQITSQLQQLYSANPSQFTSPETVSVKHILICYVGATSCASNLTKDQANQTIVAIYNALLDNKSSFEALAQQYSTDSGSAARGGDLGNVARSQTVPAFETVAFSTPVGTISQPFETPFGFHILAVYGRQAAQQLSFAQVAPQLRQQVLMQQEDALLQAYVAGLMATSKVTVLAKN